jgi:uncharacterized protein
MIPSRYNYSVDVDGTRYIYNGISENFFAVSDSHFEEINTIINTPDEYTETFSTFIERMMASGFIIEDTTDEQELVKAKYEALRSNDEYRLMLLPTYECNVRCWYCTQKHEETWMSPEIVARVKRNLYKAATSGKYKVIKVDWFGGEPLLAYDIIKDVNSYVQKLCADNNLIFSSDITTNGTLLTKKRIEELAEVGIRFYQITIDGTKAEHDKIKRLKQTSAYETSMRNVALIAENNFCVLRYNYTAKNLKPNEIVNEISERIPERLRKNIRVYIHKVWQEDIAKVAHADVKMLYNKANDNHLRPHLASLDMCYADQKNFFCIFPNGRIGKCDNSNPNEVPGEILEDGTFKWNVASGYDIPVFEQNGSQCKDCRYLPVCWGPCASVRNKQLCNGSQVKCCHADVESVMADNLRARILSQLAVIE